MNSVRSQGAFYPWGSKAPRQYLEESIVRFEKSLQDSKKLGLTRIQDSVARAAHDARPLLSALEYLAHAGLRRRRGDGELVTSVEITEAIKEARCSIAELAQSSGWTLRNNLESLGRAMDKAIALAQVAVAHGIEGQVREREVDPWSGIPDPRRQHSN